MIRSRTAEQEMLSLLASVFLFFSIAQQIPKDPSMNLFDVVKSSPELILHIQRSVHETLKIYARSDIVPKAHFFKSHTGDLEVTIIGMLDLREENNTSVLSLGFSHAVFVMIYENMFQEQLTEVSLETADLAGELINIVFQSIDPELRRLGHRFDTSLPKVLTKSDLHEWVKISADESLVLPFSTECGDILFEIFETQG